MLLTIGLRTISLVALGATALMPPATIDRFAVPETQVAVISLVIMLTIVGDAVAGLTLGIAAFVVYYRLHRDSVLAVLPSMGAPNTTRSLVRKYITPEDLQRAQDNTLPGFRTPHVEGPLYKASTQQVYGAQGLDASLMPGQSPDEVAMGAPL